MPRQFKLTPLSVAVLAILGGTASQAQAQNAAPAADTQPEASAHAVVVTGSRIPRASLEGPSPVTILTGDEITKQGYKNVYDALSNQVQNSGFTQGEDFGNTFTPSANTISLRGLGPNHTLILLNGRRLADFPVAYEGTVNFTNLANIPSSIVDRIEILNGGASAIYGSDAIAGVINVILKKQTEGFDINVKAGTTTRGGGGSCTGRWYGVGRLNYSLRDKKLVDAVVGVEYDAGCWIGRVVFEKLTSSVTSSTKRVMFQLEFIGLSKLGTNPLRALRNNIPGYEYLRQETTPPSRFTAYD